MVSVKALITTAGILIFFFFLSADILIFFFFFFFFFFKFFREIRLDISADDSHEMPSLIFSKRFTENLDVACCNFKGDISLLKIL